MKPRPNKSSIMIQYTTMNWCRCCCWIVKLTYPYISTSSYVRKFLTVTSQPHLDETCRGGVNFEFKQDGHNLFSKFQLLDFWGIRFDTRQCLCPWFEIFICPFRRPYPRLCRHFQILCPNSDGQVSVSRQIIYVYRSPYRQYHDNIHTDTGQTIFEQNPDRQIPDSLLSKNPNEI